MQGPCLEAFRSGRAVTATDLRARRADWPDVVRIAEERGYNGVHAAPVAIRQRTFGTLCVFFPGHRAMDDQDAVGVHLVADGIAAALARERIESGHDSVDTVIRGALEVRDTIEEAKGALSWRLGIPVEQAFEYLRDRARHDGVRVGQAAEHTIAGGRPL